MCQRLKPLDSWQKSGRQLCPALHAHKLARRQVGDALLLAASVGMLGVLTCQEPDLPEYVVRPLFGLRKNASARWRERCSWQDSLL